MSTPAPTLLVEHRLLAGGSQLLACVDEVGRGSLAGPVSVGVVTIDASVLEPVEGVRDSKLLSPAKRLSLVETIRSWSKGYAVGHASANEVDEYGLTMALRLAGHRALLMLPQLPDTVLLDGNLDWMTPRNPGLLDPPLLDSSVMPDVVTMVKADMQCAGVAAASVLAKVERDEMMINLARMHPGYEWDVNKGYATPAHLEALRRLGPSTEHRRTWKLT